MALSFVLTAKGRSHAGDTELRTSRKSFPHRRPPDCSVVQAAASCPPHFRAHQTQTALLGAHVAFASALRYRGLSAHGALLPQVWLDTVFLEGHSRSRDVLRGSPGGNALFTSRRSVPLRTSSTFSFSQQDNKCLGAPSRESHAPQRTKQRKSPPCSRTHAHKQVGQSQENQRAHRRTHSQNLRSRKTPPITVRDQELHAATLPIASPPKLP